MHSTAAGKAVLSALDEDQWVRLLPPEPFPELTPNTRRTASALSRDIKESRKRGWTLDDEESELSGVCVGAPILAPDGRPVAAISVCSVAGRLPAELRPALGLSVKAACDRLTHDLARHANDRKSSPTSSVLHTA
jgi:IclR family acetate operon transcriptional repressor